MSEISQDDAAMIDFSKMTVDELIDYHDSLVEQHRQLPWYAFLRKAALAAYCEGVRSYIDGRAAAADELRIGARG